MTATDKMGEIIFNRGAWKIYKQDVGMGETDYCILHNDVFFARTDMLSDAKLIVNAVDRYLNVKVIKSV